MSVFDHSHPLEIEYTSIFKFRFQTKAQKTEIRYYDRNTKQCVYTLLAIKIDLLIGFPYLNDSVLLLFIFWSSSSFLLQWIRFSSAQKCEW